MFTILLRQSCRLLGIFTVIVIWEGFIFGINTTEGEVYESTESIQSEYNISEKIIPYSNPHKGPNKNTLENDSTNIYLQN